MQQENQIQISENLQALIHMAGLRPGHWLISAVVTEYVMLAQKVDELEVELANADKASTKEVKASD